jgi:hypothetical protein
MNAPEEKRWFRAYWFGLGYVPATWQGWIVLAIIVAGCLTLTHFLYPGISN